VGARNQRRHGKYGTLRKRAPRRRVQLHSRDTCGRRQNEAGALAGRRRSEVVSPSQRQSGSGVPQPDGVRCGNDISMTASENHDGYRMYSGGTQRWSGGGRSVSRAVVGGNRRVINQRRSNGGAAASGTGQHESKLYALAQEARARPRHRSGDNMVTITVQGPGAQLCDGNYG